MKEVILDTIHQFTFGIKDRTEIIMITIARLISVFTTAYSVDGSIIPYNTWWGILIWVALIAAVGFVSWIVYKNGEKIENWFKRKFSKKTDEKTNDEGDVK